ncbi:hypothetical protein AAV35_011320 [Salimicrobium jeotgali]|uniref:Uncharacterized protein n=2 Tax=Salimicrobium jeotgali TaxID=1230341 RepID=K2H691_9BACI|nr:hypothetical protein AAV35_011320 [Salimicrobium jeotgali]EKE31310.1 hypothetical protein MJ3_08731 [Salimicrobium jeotgali]
MISPGQEAVSRFHINQIELNKDIHKSLIAPVNESLRLKAIGMSRNNSPVFADLISELKKSLILKFPEIEEDITVGEEAILQCNRFGWSFVRDFHIETYIEAAEIVDRQDLSYKEKQINMNDFFVKYLDEGDPGSLGAEVLVDGLGEEWEYLAEHVMDLVSKKEYQPAIPLIMILIERMMVNLDRAHLQEKIQKKVINSFEKQITKQKKEFQLYTLKNFDAMFEKTIRNNIFKSDTRPHRPTRILNRHLVVHGKSNPSTWTDVDMYQLLTVLLSLAEVIREHKKLT